MNSYRKFRIFLAIGLAAALAGVAAAQGAPDKALVVNGKAVDAKVRQIDGHLYVDVEALAQATNWAITIEAKRVVLTIPGQASTGGSTTARNAPPEQPTQALSRAFASAATAEVAEMREWRGGIGTMITYGLAVSGAWAEDYHAQVNEGLRQTTLAASTDGDRNALQLLKNQADLLASWSSTVFAARAALDGSKTLDPNSQKNDPVLLKITNCSRFLNAMLVSGSYSDDGSCH